MTDPYAALEAANIGLANVLSYRTYSGSRAPGKVEWDSAQRALDLVRAALDARQVTPMSQPNRKIAYAASDTLRKLGYQWDEAAEAWRLAAAPPAQRLSENSGDRDE